MERDALLSGTVHPGGRAPAPGRLALVQMLVNTVDREHGPDLLADAEGLTEWLAARGLLEPGAGSRPPGWTVPLSRAARSTGKSA